MRFFGFTLVLAAVLLLGCDDSVIHESIYPIQEEESDDFNPDVPDENTVVPDDNEVVSDEEAANVVVASDYWISDTGVAHNSLCRWYRNCAGKEWDGIMPHNNCQTCGGTDPIVRRWNLKDDK